MHLQTSDKMAEPFDHPHIYLYKRIVRAKLFIDRHYPERIDLSNISDEAYFSKFHFIRLFKSVYGKTPHQYLTGVRIEKSKEFLREGYSVNETCTKVGFDSPTSFASLFRRYTKFSPANYQRWSINRQREIRHTPLKFIPNCFASQNGWTEKSNFEEQRPV